MAIQYVGGRGAGRAGSTSAVAVAINSGLTGGIGAAALAGDLVVVVVSTATQARAPSCAIATPTGYTPLTVQRTTATTYDTNVQVCYKIMGGTPDTSVTIPATGNIADGQAYRIMVFRGVDPTTPMDAAATYAVGTAVSNLPNGASITPVTAGAWIVVAGGGAAGTGTTLYTAAALSGFVSYNGADTNDGTVGMGYYSGWSSGAYDPAAWTGGSTNAANSWGATTLALRPAASTTPKTIDGTLTLAGAVGRDIAKQVTGILASAGALNRKTGMGIAGPLAFAGSLATDLITSVQQAVAGTLSAVGVLGLRVLKGLTGAWSGSGAWSSKVLTPQQGSATFAGGISFTFRCSLAGGIDFNSLLGLPSEQKNDHAVTQDLGLLFMIRR